MPTTHTVQQGECLSSIAAAYGFAAYAPIWDHPANRAHRERRPDPAMLFPGDKLTIPDRVPKSASVSTGKSHRFVVTQPQTAVRLTLKDADGQSLSETEYVLEVKGREQKGKTDSAGLLVESVPASAHEAILTLPSLELTLKLRLGQLDPVETVSGQQARLNSLGHPAGLVDGKAGPRTRAALAAFQREQGLDASGEPDDDTLSTLAKVYGC